MAALFIYILGCTKKKNTANVKSLGQEYLHQDIKGIAENASVVNTNMIMDILSVCIPILFFIIVVTKILFFVVIPDNSMYPKFSEGNLAVFNRLAYVSHEPKRGEVILFFQNDSQELYTSRIIGLPGDHVEFRDGYVVINDRYCNESAYLGPDVETNCSLDFLVPANSYFVLDDFRMGSEDSRHWISPYIPISNIKGKYMGQINCDLSFLRRK